MMKLQDGIGIATAFFNKVKDQCHRIEVVGSIRRGRPEVNDIDFVCVPKRPWAFLPGVQAIQRGPKIIRFEYLGAEIDLYIAQEDNYEVLRLIRTGSARHNVKLATIAKKQGWQLNFERGLITPDGEIRTEDRILTALLGYIPEPKDRE